MIIFGHKNCDCVLDYVFVFTWRVEHASGLIKISNVWFNVFRLHGLFIDITHMVLIANHSRGMK